MSTSNGTPRASPPCGLNAIYTALDPHLPEIRLLKLLPSASFDAPLECRLVHRPLYGDVDAYEALSYVWGSNKFTAEITLNNEVYYITQNLEAALRYLRRPSAQRTLWVDALCINQHDPAERSRQVLLMRDIYARCTTDLAWMQTRAEGPHGKPSPPFAALHEAFDLISKISFRDAETLARMRDGPFAAYCRTRGDADAVPAGAFLLSVEEQMCLIQAFGAGGGIWARVWTMQELACAPRVTLVAGDRELDWEVVKAFLGDRPYADAFHAVFGHWGGGKALDLFFSGAVRVHDQRRALRDGNYKSTLLDVLARFQQNRATDLRDCVYGVLGLVTEPHGVVVDYTKSTRQVFVDAAVSLISASRDLDLLCQTAWMARLRSENPHDIPSWVPDFSASIYSDAHRGILFAQRGIYAAGRANLDAPCRPVDGQFLPVRAVVLGNLRGDCIDKFKGYTLTSVVEYREYFENRSPNDRPQMWSLFRAPFDWLERSGLVGGDMLGGNVQYDRTGEPAVQAYWRTLVMDCGAYPIQRLTEQEIMQTGVAFKSILELLTTKLPASASASEKAHETSVDTKEPPSPSITSGDEDLSIETLISLWESMPKSASTMWCRNYHNWVFSMTDNGLYTMVQDTVVQDTMAGDIIASVEGAKVPLVLRKQGSHDGVPTYSLVGTAYVHGYMDGEALELVGEGMLKEEEILLR